MNKIAIFNQKGGVGKSSIAVNLSASLYKLLHKRVLVIDCDAQANSSSFLLAYGHDNEKINTLVDFVQREVPLEDCIYSVIVNKGHAKEQLEETKIDILPIDDRLDNTEFKDVNVLKDIVSSLEDKYDYCLFDCSPQKTTGVVLALCACDYVLVPMDSGDLDSIQGWNMVLNLIEELKENRINDTIRILGVVVNFYNRVRSVHSYMLGVFKDTFKDALFETKIRDSADIEQAKIFRQPICYYKPSSQVGRDYDAFTKELDKRVEQLNRKVGK